MQYLTKVDEFIKAILPKEKNFPSGKKELLSSILAGNSFNVEVNGTVNDIVSMAIITPETQNLWLDDFQLSFKDTLKVREISPISESLPPILIIKSGTRGGFIEEPEVHNGICYYSYLMKYYPAIGVQCIGIETKATFPLSSALMLREKMLGHEHPYIYAC